LMVTGEMFDPVVEQFATRHRVIIPDLRGHGRSQGLPPPYTAAQLASDLSLLLLPSLRSLQLHHAAATAPRYC
jgi:3-oxoadipate enol-lactonase